MLRSCQLMSRFILTMFKYIYCAKKNEKTNIIGSGYKHDKDDKRLRASS